MNEMLASCQGSSLGWRGEAGYGVISRNKGKVRLVQRNSRRRRARKWMVQSCKIMGNRGSSTAGQFAIREMVAMRGASKRGVGRGGGNLVVVKAVRNAKGQRIDAEDVQVQSSMGEGSFGQVFQVSSCDW